MSESAASAKSKNSWRTQSAILIDLIVPYLRNPIPAPLSCPPRNALRQQGLATAMRVSKVSLAFNILNRKIKADIYSESTRLPDLIYIPTSSLMTPPKSSHWHHKPAKNPPSTSPEVLDWNIEINHSTNKRRMNLSSSTKRRLRGGNCGHIWA